jgi:hypothetical protein
VVIIGMHHVRRGQNRYMRMSASDLDAYLQSNPIPAYVGPENNLYITVRYSPGTPFGSRTTPLTHPFLSRTITT